MPSRFFDYESDLLHLPGRKKKQPVTGYRRTPHTQRVRRNSTSDPDSAAAVRSSLSSGGSSSQGPSNSQSNPPSKMHQPGHRGSMSTGALVSAVGGVNFKDVVREQQVEPTAHIQEWAHQVHLQQQRRYGWCTACYPKPPTLQIPNERAMRNVRRAEPTHAYE